MAKYYISTGTLGIIFSTIMMLAEELYMNAIPMMRLMMNICIVMSVGTGTILLLTQPRM